MSERVKMPHEHGIANFYHASQQTITLLASSDLEQYSNTGYIEPRARGEAHRRWKGNNMLGMFSFITSEPCIEALGKYTLTALSSVDGKIPMLQTEKYGDITIDIFTDSFLIECDLSVESELMRIFYIAGGKPRKMGRFIFIERKNYSAYTHDDDINEEYEIDIKSIINP